MKRWALLIACVAVAGCDKRNNPSTPTESPSDGGAWEALAWIPKVERGEVAVFEYGLIRKQRHLWWGTPFWRVVHVIWADIVEAIGLPESSFQRCVYFIDSPASGWTEAYLIQTSLSVDEIARKMSAAGAEEKSVQGARAWKKDGVCTAFVDGWFIRAGNYGGTNERGVLFAERLLRAHAGSEASLRSMAGMTELFSLLPKSLPVDFTVGMEAGDAGRGPRPRMTAMWGDAAGSRAVLISGFETDDQAAETGRQLQRDAAHRASRPKVELRGKFVQIDLADRHIEERAKKQVQSDLAHLCAELENRKRSDGRYPTTEEGVSILIREWDTCGERPLDPWGNPYHYRFPHPTKPGRYDLRSAGPDGKIGTLDDILPELSPGQDPDSIVNHEREARRSLRLLTTAEMILKVNDLDGNGALDFWVGDVSGLYRILDKDKNPIKLIDADLAEADAAPQVLGFLSKHTVERPQPKSGYLFRVIDRDETGKSFSDGSHRNLSRYAFCAFPAEYGKTGVMTLIIDEANVTYAKDTGGKPVDQWPGEKDRSASWKKVE